MKRLLIILIMLSIGVSSAYSIDTLKSVENKVLLEENDTLAIKNVRDIAISPNGKLLALIDLTRSYFSLVNTESGKLQNAFVTDKSLNHVLMDKKDYWDDYSRQNYVVIDNHTADSLGFNINNIQNIVNNIRFLNDTTLLSGMTVRAYAANFQNKKSILMNNSAYFIFDKNLNIIHSSPFQGKKHGPYPVAWSICSYNDNEYIVPISNREYYEKKIYDSLYSFILYDSSGQYKRPICFRPNDYVKDSLGDVCFYEPKICKINDKYYWTSTGDYKVRDMFDATQSFAIQGFDSTNYDAEQNYVKQRRAGKKIPSYNYQYIYKVVNIDQWTSGTIAVEIDYHRNCNVQFYNAQGKLLGHYILKPSGDLVLQTIAFYPKLSRIYAVVKDTENYYLTYFEIPKIEDK